MAKYEIVEEYLVILKGVPIAKKCFRYYPYNPIHSRNRKKTFEVGAPLIVGNVSYTIKAIDRTSYAIEVN